MERAIKGWRQRICLLAAAVPAILPLWMIARFGTNFPFWDEWDPDIAGIYVKAHQHQLTFSDLAAQHNEHRILIPRLIDLLINTLTHHNAIILMICGWLVAALTSIGIYLLLRRTLEPASRAWAWFLCNVLIFTPQQWQTWLWGMGLGNLLPMMFTVFALLVAASQIKPWIQISLIVLLCSAATYSTGTGVIAWPLAGMVLIWSESWNELKRKLLPLGVLIAACAANIALYLIGYSMPQHSVEEARAGNLQVNLFYLGQFFLGFLGNGFATSTTLTSTSVAANVGGMMLILLLAVIGYIAARFRSNRAAAISLARRAIVWLAVAGYTLLNAVLATATRARFGLAQAMTPRYISFGLYLELALVPLLIIVWHDFLARRKSPASAVGGFPQVDPLLRWALASLLLVVLLPPILSWRVTLDGCSNWREFIASARGVTLLAKILPDNPQLATKLNPKPAEALQNVLALNELGCIHPPLIESPNAALIQAPVDPKAGTPYGKFEKIWQVDATHVGVSGWAVHPANRCRAETVFLTCDDSLGRPIIFATAYQDNTRRLDVVQALGDGGYQLCGWIAVFDVRTLPTNVRQTLIAAWALDSSTGRAYRLDGDVPLKR
jgi:hypothetical protein